MKKKKKKTNSVAHMMEMNHMDSMAMAEKVSKHHYQTSKADSRDHLSMGHR